MSSEWTATTLGEVCLKITDGAHASPKSVAIGKPMASVKDMSRFGIDLSSARQISVEDFESLVKQGCRPEIGDVLIAKDCNSALDTVCNIKNSLDAVLLSSVAILRPNKKKIDSDFLKFYLSSSDVIEYLKSTFISGAAIPRVVLRDFKKAVINIPPLSIQKEIAAVLNAIENRIFILRETNTTLEGIAQALFKSWFVDFDPVHAKMQGRVPEGMDQATAALFPDSFEESELGPVPKGWRVGLLGDIAKTVKKQLSPTDLHAGLNYVGLEHIPRKSLSLVDWDDAAGLESAKAAFSKGDVLFGKLRPYFHKVVIAPFDGVCSTDILVCQPTKPSYRGIAAQHLFSDELISYADRLSNGAKMPRVNWGDLAAYQVVLPTEVVSDAFSNAIDPLIERIIHNVHEAKTLASLRDTLLPRLISGQISLPEIGQLEESLA